MKKLVLFVWIIFSFLPLEAEILSHRISPGMWNLLAIRVEFKEDTSPYTTGNGKFMTNEWIGHDTTYVLDALPHDRNYFKSHLTFINNYWDKASAGNISVNTDDAYVLPVADSAYTLSELMRYYSDPDSLDYRLADLVYESVMKAVNAGEFVSDNDGVIIYHAGAGQDFKIDLDDSPFDIPSFYFDETYLSEYLSYDEYMNLMAVNCVQGVVLPESQNQLGVNIALNGTEILLTGMLLGLPTLYDTEFGRSGAGTFGLMDQGSNAGSGLSPIKPSAYERYLLGASDPVTISETQNLTLLRDEVYKLPISSNEYFLIEFRKNSGIWADSLMWSRDDVGDYLDVLRVLDSLDLVEYSLENGVLTDISDLDLALPTDGLLIWHIVEPDLFGENPNNEDNWFLNLVEADGGDDIGKWYGTFDPSVNNGWKWDMWFEDNPAYEDNNPSAYKMQFNNNSHPNTRSKAGLPSGINIHDFDFYADSVVIKLIYERETTFNFDGVVFDEMTTAFADVYPASDLLLGYKDSSIVVFDENTLFEIYKQDTAYVKGQTAFLSYDNSLVQITNNERSSDVSFLANTGGLIALSETKNIHIAHPLDLEHIALQGDTLFLPPVTVDIPVGLDVMPQPRAIYKLNIPSWTLDEIAETGYSVVPYVKNSKIEYVVSDAAAWMNGDVISSEYYGFMINGQHVNKIIEESVIPEDTRIYYPDQHRFDQIIPLHLNNDGEYEILALTDLEDNKTLSAFSHNGPLLNNFPIFKDYSKIRVFESGNSPMIAAYNPTGVIDIINPEGSLYSSTPAPVNASTFFIEQVAADTAWMVVDGSIIPVSSSGVYWGYNGKDAEHSNAIIDIQSGIPLGSNNLTAYSIYNYPNPIEGARTKFRFFSTGATHATVTIYSLDGRYITKLEHDVTDQQWNEIPWFVLNEESGVYLAKIEITDGSKTETHIVKPAILK